MELRKKAEKVERKYVNPELGNAKLKLNSVMSIVYIRIEKRKISPTN